MVEIHTVSDFQTGAKEAANALTDVLTRCRTDAVLLLFSGGSPLEIAKMLPPDIFDARITIGVSDERFSTDPTINNFAQVRTMSWYAGAVSRGMHVMDTRPMDSETLDMAADRFDTMLKTWKHHFPSGKIIITQGIGLDGHTAGMMPYPENPDYFDTTFIHTPSWIVGYDAKEKNKYPLRITTTVPFLLQVDHAIMFACGADKQLPVEQVFANKDDIAAVPGRIIHTMKRVAFFTDRTW